MADSANSPLTWDEKCEIAGVINEVLREILTGMGVKCSVVGIAIHDINVYSEYSDCNRGELAEVLSVSFTYLYHKLLSEGKFRRVIEIAEQEYRFGLTARFTKFYVRTFMYYNAPHILRY